MAVIDLEFSAARVTAIVSDSASILIQRPIGGINGLAPVLALHLIPRSGEPLVSHLRMVDKYSMNPPTTYVKKEFSHLLQDRKDVVEYRQMNLTRIGKCIMPSLPSSYRIFLAFRLTRSIDHIRKSFADPSPNSQPYTHIIDLTGEVLFDRSAEIFISQTLNVSLSIALEASRNPVKSYLRHVPPFYEHVEDKIYKEEDVEGWKPWATRGAWWHESIRAIANIPNLPLVVLRGAEPYGPGLYRGIMPVALMVAFVYGHMDKEMALLWGPQLRRNTINTIDWAGAVWATSVWASDKSRSMLDRAAGVTVLPSGDTLVEETEGTVKKIDGGVVVPTFNLVDEGDTNQVKMASLYRNMFRIKTLFPSDLDSASFEGMSEVSYFELCLRSNYSPLYLTSDATTLRISTEFSLKSGPRSSQPPILRSHPLH